MEKSTNLEAYYYQGDVTRSQMRHLAYFAEKFAEPEFVLGHYHSMPVTTKSPRKPKFTLSATAKEFVTYCINEQVIEPNCLQRMEWNFGKIAMGGEFVADATPFELIEMLTYILGNHVHWQSRLIKAYQSNLLQQILDRAAQWANPEMVEGPILEELAA
jgi:hypothetical protein